MGNPLEGVGAFLREERSRRSVTLEEISDHTKISVRFLDALERGDYSILPAEAFVRGFVRAYARYIGVDPEEVIERLNQYAAADQARQRTLAPDRPPALSKRASSKKLVGIVSLTVILVVGAVLFAMYKIFTGHPIILEREPVSVTAGPRGQEGAGQPGASQLEAIRSVEGGEPVMAEPPLPLRPRAPQAGLKPVGHEKMYASEAPPSIPEPATHADALRLSITASDETWVELSIDDGNKEERVKLDPGMTKTWLANEKFVLTLGNMRGTRIALNDRTLSLPFNNSNVLRNYTLTREMLQ